MRVTRFLAAVLIVMVLLSGSVLAQYAPGKAPELNIRDTVPDFKLQDTDGKEWKLSDFRNRKVVLLDFGSMCVPCANVAKELENLHRQYKEKGLQIFTVFVNPGYDNDTINQYRKDAKLTFPFLVDKDQKVARSCYVRTIPYLVLVDMNGKVAYTHLGEDPRLVQKLSRWIDPILPKSNSKTRTTVK